MAVTRITVANVIFDIPTSSFLTEGVMKIGLFRAVVVDSWEVRLTSKNKMNN